MSIYILEDYIITSKAHGTSPTGLGLYEHKRKFWKE